MKKALLAIACVMVLLAALLTAGCASDNYGAADNYPNGYYPGIYYDEYGYGPMYDDYGGPFWWGPGFYFGSGYYYGHRGFYNHGYHGGGHFGGGGFHGGGHR